jgi:hypothetical protein
MAICRVPWDETTGATKITKMKGYSRYTGSRHFRSADFVWNEISNLSSVRHFLCPGQVNFFLQVLTRCHPRISTRWMAGRTLFLQAYSRNSEGWFLPFVIPESIFRFFQYFFELLLAVFSNIFGYEPSFGLSMQYEAFGYMPNGRFQMMQSSTSIFQRHTVHFESSSGAASRRSSYANQNKLV